MIRLDKFLSLAGYGTRKEVKKLIKSKLVSVDSNIIIQDSFKFDENNSVVSVANEIVDYQEHLYIMMNKPDDCVCANEDHYNNTVFEYLEELSHRKLTCVGRLDKDTTGLLIISDDGKFNHQITSPKNKVNKVYHALINGFITDNDIERFKKGIVIDNDVVCLPASLKELEHHTTTSLVEIVICEGKFHQVKKMISAIDLKVLKLHRVQIGGLKLDDDLKLGEYRFLSDDEILSIFKK